MQEQPQGARQAAALTVTALMATLGLGALAWVLDPVVARERLSADGQLLARTSEWLQHYATIAGALTAAAGGALVACLVCRGALRRAVARRPLFLPRLALVVGACCVGLLLAEWIVRVIGGVDQPGATDSATSRDSSSTWRAGLASQLDSRGYRELRLEQPRTPGTARILVVGDSFVFGYGVAAAEDTFPAALERQLEERRAPGKPHYEVLNAGRPGADPAREFAVLRELVPELSPDLVLIGYYVNDCETTEEKRAFFASRHLLPVISENLERISRLWGLAERIIVRRLEAAGLRASYVEHLLEQTAPGSADWEEHRADVVRLLERARPHAVLVIFPLVTDFEHYPLSVLHERIAAVAEELGVPVLDFRAALGGLAPDKLVVSDHDPHLNEDGLALVAEATAQFLIQHELLPDAP